MPTSIHILPPELRSMILASAPNIPTLCALSRTSRAFRDVFKADEPRLVPLVLRADLSALPLARCPRQRPAQTLAATLIAWNLSAAGALPGLRGVVDAVLRYDAGAPLARVRTLAAAAALSAFHRLAHRWAHRLVLWSLRAARDLAAVGCGARARVAPVAVGFLPWVREELEADCRSCVCPYRPRPYKRRRLVGAGDAYVGEIIEAVYRYTNL